MNLILELVARDGQDPSGEPRKVFGVEGGRIGRASDCDWVLRSPYISRYHATVCYIDGTFHIVSTSDNGVALNDAYAVLPQLENRPLKDGDRLFIDEYEIAVSLSAAVPVVLPPAPRDDVPEPMGIEEELTRESPLLRSAFGLDPLRDFSPSPPRSASAQPDFTPDPIPSASTPPLFTSTPVPSASTPPLFTSAPSASTRPQDAAWNHSPSLADHFMPPPVAPAHVALPADWDRTQLPTPAPTLSSTPASLPTPPTARPTPGLPPTSPAAPPTPGLSPTPPPAPPAPGLSPAPRAALPTPGLSPTPPASPPLPVQHQTPQPTVAPSPGDAPSVGPVPASSGTFELTAFLRCAGIDPDSLAPEMAATLGRMLRAAIQGLIEALHTRADFRDQFRLPVTRVKQSENNPLKFAVDADDAWSSLLRKRADRYLGPLDAIDDAFDDIRTHHLAMVVGMQAGFQSMLSRFNPKILAQEFDKRSRRGALWPVPAGLRYWRQYVDLFEVLTAGEAETTFRRLFGDEFAHAYERYLDTAKHQPGNPS